MSKVPHVSLQLSVLGRSPFLYRLQFQLQDTACIQSFTNNCLFELAEYVLALACKNVLCVVDCLLLRIAPQM